MARTLNPSRLLLLVLIAAGCSGCGTIIKDRSLEPQSPVGGFGAASGSPSPKGGVSPADVVTLDLPRLIGSYTPNTAPPAGIEDAISRFDQQVGSPDRRAEYRNEIVGAILMASEKNCEVYVEYLHGNQVAIRALSSVFATVFSGAAAVVTPVSSARILSALGSASSGVGGNIDQAAFSKLAAETIVAGIHANQAQGLQQIRTRMSSSYGDWSLAYAIRDALEVHDRCDAISALGYLQGNAQKTADMANPTTLTPAPTAPPSGSAPALVPGKSP